MCAKNNEYTKIFKNFQQNTIQIKILKHLKNFTIQKLTFLNVIFIQNNAYLTLKDFQLPVQRKLKNLLKKIFKIKK